MSDNTSPLSWDELKQMEGKPVWIRILDSGWWCFVKDASKADDEEVPQIKIFDINTERSYILLKEDYGMEWAAYQDE